MELRDIAVRRCVRCGQMGVSVPDARGLDLLVLCLRAEGIKDMPPLVYEDGRWRIFDVSRDHRGGPSR